MTRTISNINTNLGMLKYLLLTYYVSPSTSNSMNNIWQTLLALRSRSILQIENPGSVLVEWYNKNHTGQLCGQQILNLNLN